MKREKNYLLHTVAGQNVIVPVGSACKDFDGIMTVNETGKFLWEQLSREVTIDELVNAITAEYHVTSAQAKADIEEFLDSIRQVNCLIE